MPCTSSLDCSIYIIPCYSAVYMLLSASSVVFSKPLFLNSFYSPSLIIPSVVLHSVPYSLQSSFRDSVLSHCINANYSCSVSFRCYGYMIIYFFLIGERWNTFLLTFLIYKKTSQMSMAGISQMILCQNHFAEFGNQGNVFVFLPHRRVEDR